MPTYEYQCDKCKKTFEAVQSMKDDAFTICPKALCQQKSWGKGKVRRQIGTGAGLIFKGSGFYTTDYRSEGYKTAAQADAKGLHAEYTAGKEAAAAKESSGAKESGGSKEAPKAEAKPAPAPEKKPTGGAKKK